MRSTAIKSSEVANDRFAGLLSRDDCKRGIFDYLVYDDADCVVAPTRGSIVPRWLLIVPRRPAINFREWSDDLGKCVTGLIGVVLEALDVSRERAIWFEHGPAASGSTIGCGMDYAHIHILIDAPFSFDQFTSSAISASALPWRRSLAASAYYSIDAVGSYFIAGSQQNSVIAQQVETAGSQFFRRVVAQLVEKAEQWDYNKFPHLHNAQETIATFARKRALTTLP